MRSAECLTVIEQKSAVGDVQSRDSEGPVFTELLAEGNIEGSVILQVRRDCGSTVVNPEP